jgi:galactokinase
MRPYLLTAKPGSTTLVPLNLGDYCLAIIGAKRQRSQSESVYKERAADCNAALACLQPELGIDNLCQIDAVTLNRYKYLVTDETIFKRALHVIEENDRVKAAVELLVARRYGGFWRLDVQVASIIKKLIRGKQCRAGYHCRVLPFL